jgi:hypothetical protein
MKVNILTTETDLSMHYKNSTFLFLFFLSWS